MACRTEMKVLILYEEMAEKNGMYKNTDRVRGEGEGQGRTFVQKEKPEERMFFRLKGDEWRDSLYYGVAAIKLAASKCPPDTCIEFFESHPPKQKVQTPQKRILDFLVRVARFVVLRSCSRRAGNKQMSAGHLHIVRFDSQSFHKKKPSVRMAFSCGGTDASKSEPEKV